LEAAAIAGDDGAVAALAALLDGSVHNPLQLSSASWDVGQSWRQKALARAPEQARFFQIAKDPALSDEYCASVRQATMSETEAWLARARTWGLEGLQLTADLTVSAEEFRDVDAQRAQFVAMARLARQLTDQLELWEKTIESTEFDPEADARFIQGYEAWQGNDESERDLAIAVDYFAQSIGLGQPMAPLVLAYFFGSGYGGFPKDAELSRRFRSLGDARLTAMAEDDNRWAQTILGSLLIDQSSERDDQTASPVLYEWLPLDRARGFKWLQLAAAQGGTLPPNFGDAQGQTTAWYLSEKYSEAKNAPACSKWKVIDELFRDQLSAEGTTDAAWDGTLSTVQRILSESPEAEEARLKLDQAVDQTEGTPLEAETRGRRALALQSQGLLRLALSDAEHATRIATGSPATWKILAPIQQALGQKEEAALSLSMMQALENDPAGLSRFEATFAKVDADRRESIQELIKFALEEQPQSAILQRLKASADKLSNPRRE
jgi:TPR repeat protein